MTEHLSTQELEQHYARRLAPESLLRVDEHLSACDSCQQKFSRVGSLPETSTLLRLPASAEDDNLLHLDYEQFAAYLDGTMSEVEQEIADSHLVFCTPCADELNELRVFSQQISPQRVEAIIKEKRPSLADRWLGWLSAFTPVRAGALVAAIVLIGAIAWVARRASLLPASPLAQTPQAGSSNVPTGSKQNPSQSPNPAVASAGSNANDANNNQGRPEGRMGAPITVALNDGASQVTLDWQGNLAGLESLPRTTQRAVKEALTNKAVSRPALPPDLSGQKITLLDTSAPGVPFSLVQPIGLIVESPQPTLRWHSLKGATGYVVAIFDDNFKAIARSEQLSGTAWMPPHALVRGHIYSWQVTALKDGEKVVSPTPPAPEARFKVLDATAAAEIARARQEAGASHLALGVVYARAGLIDEAEKEFKILARKNPDSPVARKLLHSLRSWTGK